MTVKRYRWLGDLVREDGTYAYPDNPRALVDVQDYERLEADMQALVAAVDKAMAIWRCYRAEESRSADKMATVLHAALEGAKAVVDPWTHAAVRLPKPDQEVLIYLDSGDRDIAQWDGKRWVSETLSLAPGLTVTHWMPLPQGPK